MKHAFILVLGVLWLGNLQAQQVKRIWTVNTLEAPESVIFDKDNNVYYVSNVAGQPAEKNGQGYITVVDANGKVSNQKWVTGFNAPKGLGLYQGQLFVADIDKVAVVDINSGSITKTYPAEGATFLNDVVIDNKGVVYITDTFGGNAIYRIKDGQISLWLKSEQLDYPNGLKIKGNQLYVSTWGVVTNPETFGTDVPGRLLSVSLKDKSIKEITGSTGNYDGLELFNNKFLMTDWIAGRLVAVDKEGNIEEIIDLNAGSADISLNRSQGILLVPQMIDGELTAYELTR